ncbi:hypothetical protein CG716_20840 [Mycolicibacterium sphagni]|uniref:O-antigen polymerase n=2 Tax=Mycolicibacterium sphagni TaxID=1786 RepID=A0A255DCW5_9MYCO|nr:hypothetical protein CG716_20840 [Mycolicibacterium sphagni]
MYFGTSSMGAYLSGNLVATAELSIRALTVGFVVLVLIEIVEPMDLIEILSRVLATVAIFLSATGTLNGDNLSGRLSGSFPPTHPNELAFIAAVPLTYFVWRTVNIDSSGIRNLAMVALGVIVYLTQSRTSAGVTALVCFFIVIRGTRDWRLRLSIVTWAIISILCTITFSNAIQDFASRGGTVSVNTLNSRQFAWSAALFSDRAVTQLLFGEGLAKKLVAVTGQYWKTQVIDSSWVGAFVQAGLIGVGLAAVLVLYAALQARRNIRPANELWLALLLLVVARSIFESGLLDSSSSFLIFMMVSLGAATSRHSALSRSAGANYWEPYLRLVDRSRRRTFDAPEAIRRT